jgi:hypothetical protein
MPKQKDLKRLVRSRMEKTGESYTAARLQVVRKKKAPVDYAALAGMSDDAVQKRTGRTWEQWVRMLDEAGAIEMPHRQIAEYVSSLGTPDWWSQMVTVGYERIRGLREKGQRRGGSYEANKSRTFHVSVTKLFDAVAGLIQEENMTVRTAKRPKTMRLSTAGGEIVQLYFTPKSGEKSSVAIQHTKLRSKGDVERRKSFWEEQLERLSRELRTNR